MLGKSERWATKILLISNADNGGNAYFTAEAINHYTEHEARAVRLMQCWLEFPYDILAPTPGELKQLMAWADVVHGRDYLPDGLPAGKPVVMTYSSMGFRNHPDKFIGLCRRNRWLCTCSTLDLTVQGSGRQLPWIPNPREEMVTPARRRHRKFTVAHAPTVKERKGTSTIVAALAKAKIPLVVVEHKPYIECLRQKARCQMLIDQFNYLYGNNAIEMWASAKPVLSNSATDKWLQAVRDVAGFLPFVQTWETEESIIANVLNVKNSRAFRKEAIERGREYFFKFHHAPRVAERVIGLYEQARGL